MKLSRISILLCLWFLACQQKKKSSEPDKSSGYNYSSLVPLFEKLDDPKPGEWLYDHDEKFESFEKYCNEDPRRPDPLRKIIYIRPFGNFDENNLHIIEGVASFFRDFFGLEVKVLEPVSAAIIPDSSRRSFNAHTQLHTKYILHHVLAPTMPVDAIAYIAFTDYDLYPDPTWNFVFGQASLQKGVGVWSYYHYGGPNVPDHEKLEFFKRVIRTAGHETGHMFSIPHCRIYKCLMNGSNSLYESDHKPLYLCPDCLHKLCWNLNMDPKEHLKKMEAFWHKNKIFATSHFYKNCLELLSEN